MGSSANPAPTAAAETPRRTPRFSPGRLRDFAPALVLVLLVVAVGAFRPAFFNPESLLVTMEDTAILFILGAGSTFVVMLGSIDLSIQAICSLASVIVATGLLRYGPAAGFTAVAVGLAAGVVSGTLHVTLRIPSFIVTLATGGVMTSAALVLSQEHSITFDAARTLGIPDLIWIAGALAVAGVCAQRYTPFGRYSVAIGAGEPATWASGVRVNRYKVIAFALSGGLAAVAGVLLAARQSSGSPSLANELLLPAVAAVIVGGTAITGGAGGIGRTVVGALIITIVRVGMTFVGINIFAQQIVFGAVLVAAVALTIDRAKIVIVK